MRIASIKKDKATQLGVVEHAHIWLIEDINKHAPGDDPFPTSSIQFIERFPEIVDPLTQAIEKLKAGGNVSSKSIDGVTFAPPVPEARKLLCVAGNYAEHIAETGGRPPSEEDILPPRVFMKPPSTTMIGSGSPLVLSKENVAVDWELELGIVIGRHARSVTPEQARDCIFGYTIVNDISERRFNPGERNRERSGDWFFDWLNGKWFDGFAPVGPYVVTTDEVGDPQNLKLKLDVNGDICQQGSTAHMLDDVYTLVSFFSKMMTLEPGDIIATGTPAGVGEASGRYLKPGDVMTGTIERLGTLITPVEFNSDETADTR